MADERITAYLLEELPKDDLERFEDECFAGENWPTQLDMAEEDLIDAYLRNELTPERRRRFELNYLTTETRQERVSIAAALLRHIDEHNAASKTEVAVTPISWAERFGAFWNSRTSGFRAATAIATVVVVAGSVWFFSRVPSPRTFATLTLTVSSNTRAEGAQTGKVTLPLNAEALKISLTMPPQSPSAERYRVELENENGDTRSLEEAGKDAQSVLVVIPSAQLSRGQYALKVFVTKTDGTERRINGSYFFVVE
jgi:methionine-rich copper-binding protein CopC